MVVRPATALLQCLRRLRRGFAVVWLMLVCIAPVLAHEIAVLSSRLQGPDRDVADALVASGTRHHLFFAGSAEGGVAPGAFKESSLVIALGVAAAEAALQKSERPVLVGLVTVNEFDRLRAAAPRARLSALFIDQPPERHLALLRAALPDADCAGLLLGPESHGARARFEKLQSRLSPQIRIEFAASARDVLPALERLLGRCPAVLTLPDSLIANPTVARALLLTSYRMQRPLFAYSRGWVEAGALAAVFSTPATATRDLLDWLDALQDPFSLPPPRMPRHFDLAVNARVARALNLPVPDEDTLRAALSAGRNP
ncbi:MAG: hypothetical protein LPJ91_08840 [Pseudazoarcus pumilus]|nr:hypothetical protein [Pseudazoarcus pumilus]